MRWLLTSLFLATLCLLPGALAEKEPVWEAETGSVSVALSDNGTFLAGGMSGRQVHFWETGSETPLWTKEADTVGGVTSLAMSTDGLYIVAGTEGKKVVLWKSDSSTPRWTYGAGMDITDVDISADGQRIVAGAFNSQLHLFRRGSSDPTWSANLGGAVTAVAVSADGWYVAGGTTNGWVKLFNRTSNEPLWSYQAAGEINSIALTANGSHLVAGSDDDHLYYFATDSNSPLQVYNTADDALAVAITADGARLAAGSKNNKVYLYHPESSSPLWDYDLGGEVKSVAFTGNGLHLVAGAAGGRVALFAIENATMLWSDATPSDVRSVAISWRGETLAAAMQDRVALYYEPSLDNQPPNATIISVDPTSALEGWNITFNGTGTDIETNVTGYRWRSTIDGWLSDQGNFTLANLSVGYHLIYLQVVDSEGRWSEEVFAEVAVGDYPAATIGNVSYRLGGTETVCAGNECLVPQQINVTIEGRGYLLTNVSANITRWHWESSKDGFLSNATNFTVDNLSRGLHLLTFRVGNDDGFWSPNVTSTLRVNGWPVAYISSVTPPPLLVGETTTLVGAGYDPENDLTNYRWTSDRDGILGNTTRLDLTNLSVGIHTISLQVRDGTGLWSKPDNRTLQVLSPPTAIANCESQGTVDQPVNFTGTGEDSDGDIVLYEWNFNSPSGNWLQSDWYGITGVTTKTYRRTGSFTAVLRVTDDSGLTGLATCKVTIAAEEIPDEPQTNGEEEQGTVLGLGEIGGFQAAYLLIGTVLLTLALVGGAFIYFQINPPVVGELPGAAAPAVPAGPSPPADPAMPGAFPATPPEAPLVGGVGTLPSGPAEAVAGPADSAAARVVAAGATAAAGAVKKTKKKVKKRKKKPGAGVPTVTIACPGCQAHMQVLKKSGTQQVECSSCGLKGEMEL